MKKPKRTPGAQFTTGHPGPTIRAAGKTWRLGFNSQNAKGRLEELIRGHVLREALRARDEIGGERGEADYERTRMQLRGGHYETGQPGWVALLKTPLGNTLFTLSLLQHHHPDATAEDVVRLFREAPEETVEALAVVAPDFYRAVAVQMGADPAAAEAGARRAVAEMLTGRDISSS